MSKSRSSRVEVDAGAYLQAIVRDITERKQAEADLRIAASAFESQEGMMITDAAGVILRVNQAFTEITGYGAEEVVGQTPRLLNSGRHDAAFYRRDVGAASSAPAPGRAKSGIGARTARCIRNGSPSPRCKDDAGERHPLRRHAAPTSRSARRPRTRSSIWPSTIR